MATTTLSQNKTKPVKQPAKHHYVRTIFASLCGMIALSLVLASILVVWVNRTLTDTNTYVSTVAPLITKPEIQNFVAAKATDGLLENAPLPDLASQLLPTTLFAADTTPEAYKAALRPVIESSIKQVISSPEFANTWKMTNQQAHAELMKQLKTGSDHLTLNLHPLIVTAIDQLKATKLAPVSSQLSSDVLKPDAGVLNITNGSIAKAHGYYDIFQKATIAIVVLTIVMAGLCVWISVHHLKTMRRMVAGTGVIALFVALAVRTPSLIAANLSKDDPVTQKAAVTIATTLFHNLQLTCLIIGIACVVVALGSKIFAMTHRPQITPKILR